MKIGIVGLPNSGKTTIFNALTGGKAKAENYPFTTIEPNVGVAEVPDKRIEEISAVWKPIRKVYPIIEFLDIAGLVKGASTGEGLGNQFLSNIRGVDVIVHVVRCFEDENVPHNYGSVDPKRDIEIIETELMLSDLEIVERNLSTKRKEALHNKKLIPVCEFLEKAQEFLQKGIPLRKVGLDQEETETAKEFGLLSAKPVIYVCNIGEEKIGKEEVKKSIGLETDTAPIVVLCGKWESELRELDEDTRKLFMEEYNVKECGLERLIHIGYKALGFITFFTTKSKEVKGWTIKEGTNAQQAAGKIHSDMERGFIKAEVIPYDVFMSYKDPAVIKAEGKIQLEGREYIVQDGDIIKFYFSV